MFFEEAFFAKARIFAMSCEDSMEDDCVFSCGFDDEILKFCGATKLVDRFEPFSSVGFNKGTFRMGCVNDVIG